MGFGHEVSQPKKTQNFFITQFLRFAYVMLIVVVHTHTHTRFFFYQITHTDTVMCAFVYVYLDIRTFSSGSFA